MSGTDLLGLVFGATPYAIFAVVVKYLFLFNPIRRFFSSRGHGFWLWVNKVFNRPEIIAVCIMAPNHTFAEVGWGVLWAAALSRLEYITRTKETKEQYSG